MNKVTINLNVKNEEEKLSPLAFGTLFSSLELVLDLSSDDLHEETNEFMDDDIVFIILDHIHKYICNTKLGFVNKNFFVTAHTLNGITYHNYKHAVQVKSLDNKDYVINEISIDRNHKDDDNILSINIGMFKWHSENQKII